MRAGGIVTDVLQQSYRVVLIMIIILSQTARQLTQFEIDQVASYLMPC